MDDLDTGELLISNFIFYYLSFTPFLEKSFVPFHQQLKFLFHTVWSILNESNMILPEYFLVNFF